MQGLLGFHLLLVQPARDGDFTRRPLLGRHKLPPELFGGFGHFLRRLTLDRDGLPQRYQDDGEDHGAEEPLGLGSALAGTEKDEPRDGHGTDGAAGQPAETEPAEPALRRLGSWCRARRAVHLARLWGPGGWGRLR